MIDPEKRNRKISLLTENLNYLKTVASLNQNDFIHDFEKKYATRHVIQECIQICIDLAFHLCLINNIGEPINYRDAFTRLGHNKLISKELSVNLERWAGLRNLLTHIYEKVDDARIFSFLQTNLQDFWQFIGEITKLDTPK